MGKGESKGARAKKILNIVLNVLAGVFFAACIFAIIASVSAIRSDGAATLFGGQARIVVSASMEKCPQTDVSGYKIKDVPRLSMVFIELVPEDEKEADEWYSGLAVGDVLTFRYYYANSQTTVTHRIVAIAPNPEGGYRIDLQGDNKDADDPTGNSGALTQTINTAEDTRDTFTYVIGKVTGQSRLLGFIVYAVGQPVGAALIIIAPCAVIMLLQILRIASALSADKKEKTAARDGEIEDLRRRLAALEGDGPPESGSEGKEDERA